MPRNIPALLASLLLWFGAAGALRAAPAPTRLYEIGVNRFVERASGELWLQRGLLNALGAFRAVDESRVLSTVTVPPAARNQTLITLESWYAYGRLGPEALAHFVADDEGTRYTLGFRDYIPVAFNLHATLDNGKLINLSTRGRASSTDRLIGGFVIDEQHRRVLVRAVGPGLAAFGVSDAMVDPFVTIFHGTMPIYFNGDWHKRPDASEMAAVATRAGAFPLAEGSKDAALLIELAPGNYTAQVEPESGGAGAVLLEIYSVP